MTKRILVAAVLWFGCLQSASVWADDWTYTMRPGDELWSVAMVYCGSARLADEIARYNNIDAPGRVRAGTRIQIPTAWLAFAPTHAVVVATSGDVQYLADVAAQTKSQSAQSGQHITMGASLITTEGSALVQFADGSQLTIQPHSRVLFNKLTAFGPAGMVDTHLRFAYGSGTSTVQPQNRGDRFRIETPEGVAAVRGTELRVSYAADDKRATTETLKGRVAFISNASTTDLPGGYGVAASPDGLFKESLLPAPQLNTQEIYTTNDTLSWLPVPQARHYAVTWSEQSNPDVTLKLSEHTNTDAAIDLPPGSYLARVRAVSATGINGNDASLALTVLAGPPEPQTLSDTVVSPVELSWQAAASERTGYQVELTRLDTLNRSEHATEQPALRQDLNPGRYQWRVRAAQSAWSTPQTFTVLPPPPENLSYTRQGRTLTVNWDRVAIADGYQLQIVATDGNTIDVSTEDNRAIIALDDYGQYTVKVASQHQALQSIATSTDVMVSRKPWWLLVFVVLALAL